MYKISQFSKISGLTVKALRYYDKEGILTPSFRDAENQYRYYSDEDLKKALLIKFLRSLEFSIMEIREITEAVDTEDDLTYVLKEKSSLLRQILQRKKSSLKK